MRIYIEGAGDVARSMVAVRVELDQLMQGAVDRAAGTLLTMIRANASTGIHPQGWPHIPGTGPGPNVATGDYRRSWRISRAEAGGAYGRARWASVESKAVQAFRLEYGFIGRDSLGRTYRQPAYPHVRPAAAAVEPMFFSWAEDAVVAAILHGFGSEAGEA